MPLTERQERKIATRRLILSARSNFVASQTGSIRESSTPVSLATPAPPSPMSPAALGGGGVTIPTDPRDVRWGAPGLPMWIKEFRPHQLDAVQQIMDAYQRGAKVVFLQAPTGTGKTIIGEMVGRLIGGKRLYVCSTKTLQDQIIADFPYAKVLKGRANYTPTNIAASNNSHQSSKWESQVSCADCTRTKEQNSCKYCASTLECPYRVARLQASMAELAVLNTSYYLVETNKAAGLFAGRDLTVIDEGDLLERELMGQVEVTVSKRWRKTLKMDAPPRKTVASTWPTWIAMEAIPKINRYLRETSATAREPSDIKDRIQLESLKNDLNLVAAAMNTDQEDEGGKGWIYTDYTELAGDHPITFRPVKVDKHGDMLWPHQKRALIMSGTILSADHMAESLGLGDAYEMVDIPMQYPVANRPIYITGVSSMSYKAQLAGKPIMAESMATIISRYPGKRVLVHTVSYHLSKYFTNELKRLLPERKIISYSDTWTKDKALAKYLKTPGAILVAASMDRGVDLPGDDCRLQIIAKIPYANVSDKQISARMHSRGGQDWYSINTLRTIMQMTGRGVRDMDDWCDTYILDSNFARLWKDVKRFAPDWWAEAFDHKTTARTMGKEVQEFLVRSNNQQRK